MNQSKTDKILSTQIKIFLMFVGLLVIGVIGYFNSSIDWLKFLSAHIGGLGIIGIIGSFSGTIAKNKGYNYLQVLLIGLIIPISLGIFTILLIAPFSCGGTPSLAASLLLLIFFSVKKRHTC